jgi:hypothetical protein
MPAKQPVAFVSKGRIDEDRRVVVDLFLTAEEAIKRLVKEAHRADKKFAKSEQIGMAPQRIARRDACMAVADQVKEGRGKDEPFDLDIAIDEEYQNRYSPNAESKFDEEAVLAELLGPALAPA